MKLYLVNIAPPVAKRIKVDNWVKVEYQVDPNYQTIVRKWKEYIESAVNSPLHKKVRMEMVEGQWEISYEQAAKAYVEIEDMEELHNFMYEYGITVTAVFVDNQIAFKEVLIEEED